MKLAVIGASGLSGKLIIKYLENSNQEIFARFFASRKSVGRSIFFRGASVEIEELSFSSFKDLDFVFFAAGSSVAKKYIDTALESGCTVIDLSSAYRKDPKSALIIPEINGHLLEGNPSLMCSPNCTTTMLLLALFPLHKCYKLKSIITSTYQAASGGGYKLMQDLLDETKNYLENPQNIKYAFNVYPHPLVSSDPDKNLEEEKMIHETKKILNDDSLAIYPTCVRVPTLRAHSLSVHATFCSDIDIEKCFDLINQAPYLELTKNSDSYYAENKTAICVSRVRRVSCDTLEMWVTGDQLLKGAALNAFQIFEELVKSKTSLV